MPGLSNMVEKRLSKQLPTIFHSIFTFSNSASSQGYKGDFRFFSKGTKAEPGTQ